MHFPSTVERCSKLFASGIGSASMSARRPMRPWPLPFRNADACLADARMDLDAPGGEAFRHQGGRAVFFEGDLGVGVEVAAPGGELEVAGADMLDGIRHEGPR